FPQHLGTRLIHAILHLLHDLLDLLLGDRGRLVGGTADKARDLGRGLHQVPRLVVHFHLDEDVTGEELALGDRFLVGAHFHDFFDPHEDLPGPFLHARPSYAIDQRALHGLLEARIGVNHIPALAHITTNPEPRRTAPIPASCPS